MDPVSIGMAALGAGKALKGLLGGGGKSSAGPQVQGQGAVISPAVVGPGVPSHSLEESRQRRHARVQSIFPGVGDSK